MPDWKAIRAQFPALARWTYLNTASFGQTPLCAQHAVERHFARRDEFACQDFLEWFDDVDRIRASVAGLIHCEPADIGFFANAAAVLSLLMGGMDWREGDRVVTLEGEFPNQLYAPALLGSSGAEFVETSWDRLLDAVTPRTRLVALSTVNYTTGFRAPLAGLAARLKEQGTLLYVDGTQSVGALPFDVSEIQPDVFATDCYKWMLSPNGATFAYISPAVREWLRPNVIGWRSHKTWRNVDNLHHGVPELPEGAERYEGGMLAFTSLYAMEASLGMLREIGEACVERRVMELAAMVRDRLRPLGASFLSDESPHFDSPIVTAAFPGVDASRLSLALKRRRVLVSARHGRLRVSPHFYNNEEDIECLAAALAVEL